MNTVAAPTMGPRMAGAAGPDGLSSAGAHPAMPMAANPQSTISFVQTAMISASDASPAPIRLIPAMMRMTAVDRACGSHAGPPSALAT